MPDPLTTLRRSLFLVSTPLVFISFALPLRAKELGASPVEIGALFTVFTVSLLIVRPLVGIGLDRFGRRPFLLAALALYVATNGLFTIGDTLAWLYPARLLQGIGMAVLLITASTITADLTDQSTRGVAMGANMENQGRGGMLGAVLGFTLVGAVPLHAWALSFASYTLVVLLALAAAWRAMPETHIADRSVPAPRFQMPATLRRLLPVVFLAALASGLVQPLYLIYLQERFGLGLQALAFVFLPVGIVYAALPSRLGKLTRSLPRGSAMASGLLAAGALYAVVPAAPGLIWVVALFIGNAVGSIVADLTRNAWVGDLVAANVSGRAFGVTELAAGMGSAAGPLIGGVLYEQLGPATVFYANGLLLLIGAALTALYVQRRVDQPGVAG